MYLHWFFCGDKCGYINFRNMTNFEIHLLYLVAGLLEGKAFRKGLVDVYIFHQPIALSKTRRFQNNFERWKKGNKDYIKVRSGLKIRFLVWDISHYTRSANFLLLNLYLLLYFPKQTILSKMEFCVGSDVHSIWCILTFFNQAFLDQLIKTLKSVPQAAYFKLRSTLSMVSI